MSPLENCPTRWLANCGIYIFFKNGMSIYTNLIRFHILRRIFQSRDSEYNRLEVIKQLRNGDMGGCGDRFCYATLQKMAWVGGV